MRFSLIALGALLWIGFAGATTAQQETRPQKLDALPSRGAVAASSFERMDAAIAVTAAHYEMGDWASALNSLATAMDEPAFAASAIDLRFGGFFLRGELEARLGNAAEELTYFVLAGELAPEFRGAEYWLRLGYAAAAIEEHMHLAEAAISLAEDYPESLGEWGPWFAIVAVRSAGRLGDGEEKKYRLLKALWEMDYRSPDPFELEDSVWLELLRLQIEHGEFEAAELTRAALVSPEHIAALSYDARFAQFAPDDPAATYARAIEVEIERLRLRAAEHPRKLAGLIRLSDRLITAGELAGALAILDDAISSVEVAGTGALPFDDLEREYAWAENYRIRALRMLGRWDEALAGQLRAKDASLADPVSQVLNLGELLVSLGRPEEALVAIEAIRGREDGASSYGLVVAAIIRVCAYQALDDPENVEVWLSFLRSHADDSPHGLKDGLLCADRRDELAGHLIERLEDPATRAETLAQLQDYWNPPTETEHDRRLRETLAEVRDRVDVQAAIRKYGRIVTWPSLAPLL